MYTLATSSPSLFEAPHDIDSLPLRGDFAHENRSLSRHRVAIFKIAVAASFLAVEGVRLFSNQESALYYQKLLRFELET